MKTGIYTKEIMNQVYEKDGWLYWNVSKGKIKKHDLAGNLHKRKGYYVVEIDGKSYFQHRILYQIYNNVILGPDDVIDHIDKDKTNNRKDNLKLSTRDKNSRNRHTNKNNKLGIKNISILKIENNEYYRLQISHNKNKFIKFFRTDKFTIDEVLEIRNKKLIELHGDDASFG